MTCPVPETNFSPDRRLETGQSCFDEAIRKGGDGRFARIEIVNGPFEGRVVLSREAASDLNFNVHWFKDAETSVRFDVDVDGIIGRISLQGLDRTPPLDAVLAAAQKGQVVSEAQFKEESLPIREALETIRGRQSLLSDLQQDKEDGLESPSTIESRDIERVLKSLTMIMQPTSQVHTSDASVVHSFLDGTDEFQTDLILVVPRFSNQSQEGYRNAGIMIQSTQGKRDPFSLSQFEISAHSLDGSSSVAKANPRALEYGLIDLNLRDGVQYRLECRKIEREEPVRPSASLYSTLMKFLRDDQVVGVALDDNDNNIFIRRSPIDPARLQVVGCTDTIFGFEVTPKSATIPLLPGQDPEKIVSLHEQLGHRLTTRPVSPLTGELYFGWVLRAVNGLTELKQAAFGEPLIDDGVKLTRTMSPDDVKKLAGLNVFEFTVDEPGIHSNKIGNIEVLRYCEGDRDSEGRQRLEIGVALLESESCYNPLVDLAALGPLLIDVTARRTIIPEFTPKNGLLTFYDLDPNHRYRLSVVGDLARSS